MSPSETRTGRIGYLLKVYPRFSETFVVSEILAREEAGHELCIISLRPPADARFHATLAEVRAPVTYLPYGRVRAAELWELLRHAQSRLPRLAQALPALLAADVIDAYQALHLALRVEDLGISRLHAHFASVATTVARLTSLVSGVPFSFTAHAKDIFHDEVDEASLREKLRDASSVVTVSEFNAAYLRQRFPAETGRLVTVRNGLRLADFPFRLPFDRELLVVAVGRLVEKKGFADLLDALALLHRSGLGVRAVLAGHGPLEPQLRARAADLGIDGVLEMPGPLPQHEVRALVGRGAVLAAPCVRGADGNVDGLPTVLLESMALGTPVVATSVTGIPELVRHGDTGLLVPEHDPAALAAALGRLLADPALRLTLARRARSLIEAEYDGRRQAQALGALVPAGRSQEVA